MGRYSSDESEDSRRRRRSRSNSHNRSRSRERSRGKKSKRKHRSPPSRDSRRSRSVSYERSRKSHKRNRRSRSRSTDRGSRGRTSDSKRRHKGSRRRSRSESRSRSGSPSRSRHGGKSVSSRSRRKSPSRSGRSQSSGSNGSSRNSELSQKPSSVKSQQSSMTTDYMSNAEKVEAKLQMALRAARDADEILICHPNAPQHGWHFGSFEDQQKRANAVEEIDSGEFTQATFRSMRSEIPMPKGSATDASHSSAMFGSSSFVTDDKKIESVQRALPVVDQDSIMHPNLFASPEEKMKRWKKKLMDLRERQQQRTAGKIM